VSQVKLCPDATNSRALRAEGAAAAAPPPMPGQAVPRAIPRRTRSSPERLGQCDHDALGAADVTQPITVVELHHLANELRALGTQAGEHGVDVVGSEHDATDALGGGRASSRSYA
jgi:hypothetical protein